MLEMSVATCSASASLQGCDDNGGTSPITPVVPWYVELVGLSSGSKRRTWTDRAKVRSWQRATMCGIGWSHEAKGCFFASGLTLQVALVTPPHLMGLVEGASCLMLMIHSAGCPLPL